MDNLNFIITPEEAGKRIDKVVADRLGEEYSRTFAQTLIQQGNVLVNGGVIKARLLVKGGEAVSVIVPPPEKNDLTPEDIPLKVLYEDDWIIVIDKPAGIVVHPGAGNKTGTIVNALLYHCGKLPEGSDELRPGIVHRLDKDTSGVLVAAKNDRALRSLAKQFQARVVKKRYLAVVKGVPPMDNGVIDAPIARSAADRKKMGVENERGKNARTIYHMVKKFKGLTLLRIDLETGRTHQIRVHMKHIGCPVLGDPVYGRADGVKRQALHAEMIGFMHPDTGKYMEFVSPVPEDIKEIIQKMEGRETRDEG